MATRYMLKNVRLAFGDSLFEAKPFQPGNPPRHSCSFLLDPSNPQHAAQIAEIKAIIDKEFEAKCGPNPEKKRAALDWDDVPLRDGNKKSEYDGFEDMMFLSAAATPPKQAAPLVMDRRATRLKAGDEGAPYSGCYVNAQVEIWGQYGTYKRVNATLLAVQFVRDGDAFGGGRPADTSAFEDLGDQGDDGEDLSGLL